MNFDDECDCVFCTRLNERQLEAVNRLMTKPAPWEEQSVPRDIQQLMSDNIESFLDDKEETTMGMTSSALFADNRSEEQKEEHDKAKYDMRMLENMILVQSKLANTLEEADSFPEEKRINLLMELMRFEQ